MNKHEQIDAFYGDLDKLIDRYKAEFDIDVYSIVGILEDKKLSLLLGEDTVSFESDNELLDDENDV
jgi:hypothetical protein